MLRHVLRALPWMLLSWACHAGTVYWPAKMRCGADQPPAVQEQTLSTPQGDIGYFRFGRGSPIVLITGYRATIANWNTAFLNALATGHEVIVFENRGIGVTRLDGRGDRIADLARDASTLISGLGLRDVTVVGWSMGGAIAQQLAVQSPAQVHRLVLMSTMAPGPAGEPVSPQTERVLSGSGADHFSAVMGVMFPSTAAQDAVQCFGKDMFRPAGYQPPAISATITEAQGHALAAWSQDTQALDALRQLKVPTLILSGTVDDVLSPLNSAALERTIPNAKWVDVSNGGHAMMFQFPQELAREISDFVGK